jgi:hypothetical protein
MKVKEELKVVTRNEGWISPQGLSRLVPKCDELRIRNDGFLVDSSSGLSPLKASIMSGEILWI